MLLEPVVVAAVVNAAGRLLPKVLEQFGGRDPDEAKSVVEKVYPSLRKEITDTFVRVLLLLESGENQHPLQVRPRLEALIDRQESNPPTKLEDDLAYRLKYLCLLGLLMPIGGTEFAITKLGRAYLEKARREHDYANVFRP